MSSELLATATQDDVLALRNRCRLLELVEKKIQRNFRIPSSLAIAFEQSVELPKRQRWLLYCGAMLAFLELPDRVRQELVGAAQNATTMPRVGMSKLVDEAVAGTLRNRLDAAIASHDRVIAVRKKQDTSSKHEQTNAPADEDTDAKGRSGRSK